MLRAIVWSRAFEPLRVWPRWKSVRWPKGIVLVFGAVLIALALTSSTHAQALVSPITATPSTNAEHPGDAPRLGTNAPKVTVPKGFSTFNGGWITIAYHPSLNNRVRQLIADANSVRAELAERLGAPPITNVRVHVARTPGEMEVLAPEGAPYPEYASGVAYSELGLVLLTATALEPTEHHDLGEIFRHELAHIALYQATHGRDVPRWFNEGFAVFASGEGSIVRLQTLWLATVSGHLWPMSKLARTFPADGATASIAYAQAADFVRFMVRREDRHRFSGLVTRLNEGLSFDQAIAESYGAGLETLEQEWNADVSQRYTFWPVLLGGSSLWVGLLGLFLWGYWRKRKEAKATLARWAKEEAFHDEVERLKAAPRVHIMLAPDVSKPEHFTPIREVEVPKVEHDGGWYTLH